MHQEQSRSIFVETTDVYGMEQQDPHTLVNLFESGIGSPRPGNGELRIILRGPLYFHSDRQEQTIEFRRR